eukprot:Nk52_evm1s1867 gene=Nk52_evmTU1s1867
MFCKRTGIHESAVRGEFLRSANPPRAEGNIGGLRDADNRIQSSQEDMEKIAVDFYSILYRDGEVRNMDEVKRKMRELAGGSLPKFHNKSKVTLRKDVSLLEVCLAIKNCKK